MPTVEHNRVAWNRLSGPGCPWSRPVSSEQLAAARSGDLAITLAGPRVVPPQWLGDVRGKHVLCLAAAGGQQAPMLAAAGAKVTLLDISDDQLLIDQKVCREHDLAISILQGSMTDLSRFADGSFDLIVNPVSTCYIPDVQPLWDECYRVLIASGRLLSGSISPVNYLFAENEGEVTADHAGLVAAYPLPYVESDHLDPGALAAAIDRQMVFTFGHTLEALLQGQMDAGFVLTGLYESRRTDERAPLINRFISTYLATCAMKS